MRDIKIEQRTQLMLELREQGLTYREIGEKVGLSKQRVYHIIGGNERNRTHRPYTKEEIVYKGLRDYINEHGLSTTAFTRLVYGQFFTPTNYQRIKTLFINADHCAKCTIDKILAATGLTYEEAFRKDDTYDATPQTNAE